MTTDERNVMKAFKVNKTKEMKVKLSLIVLLAFM